MKKTKKRLTLIGMFSALAFVCAGAFTSCQKTLNYDVLPEEGLYEYNFDQPFAAQPDAFMHLDGNFDEEIWQNKNWLESSSRNTSMRATTAFTSEGLYVGVEAYDTNITWIGRNNFEETGVEKTNSFFIIQVVKSGQTSTNDRMKDVMLYMDCKAVCSHRERQIAAGSHLVGEVNSGATTSLTGEIFIPWSELGYTEEEVNEYSYPDTLQMNVKYLRVFEGASGNNFTVKSSPLQAYTFTSYPYYNENGLMGTYDCEEFGSAIDGAPATDKWEIEKDENGKVTKLTTTVDRAQTIFFRRDSEGNATSSASDFLLETRVRVLPLGKDSVPVCGLWIGSYLVTGVRGDKLYKGQLMLQNSKSISDVQWMGEPQDYTIKNTVELDYDKGYVDLRIVKRGTEIYYFYNDIFYKVETRNDFEGAISVGLFANGKAEFTNFRFVDYSDNVQALTEYLSERVYFVEVQKATSKGSVTSDVVAVKKGEPLSLHILPGVECYLSDLQINGESKIAEVEETLDIANGTYTFVPTEDVSIAYKFDYINSANAVNVRINLLGYDNKNLGATDYRLTSDSALFFCESNSNDQGYIILSLPKAGMVFGQQEFKGKYQLYFEAEGHNPAVANFEIPADSEGIQFSAQASKTRYGATTVNGQTTDVSGKPSYNIEKDLYYVKSGNLVQYLPATLTNAESGYDYVIDATISVAPVEEGDVLSNDKNGVSGIAISSGKEKPIFLKQTGFTWEKDRLCIETGDYEVSISGFKHNINSQGGTIHINAVRYNDVIYVFDADGNVGLYLDKNGLHIVGNRQITSNTSGSTVADTLEGLNELLKQFFENGKENVVGMVNFDNVRAEYNVQVQKNASVMSQLLRNLEFSTEADRYTATIENGTQDGKYVLGSVVKIVVDCKGDEYASQLTVESASGTETIVGVMENGKTTFEFIIKDNVTATITKYLNVLTYSGRIDGATDSAKIALYDANGTYIETYSDVINAYGEYSLRLIEGEYKLIISEGNQLAFIAAGEDGSLTKSYVFGAGTVNGVPYNAATMDYATLQMAAAGTLVPPVNKKITLSNSVTNENYSYRVAVNTRESGPKNTNGTTVALTNGTNSIRILRYAPRRFILEVWRSNGKMYSVMFDDIANGTDYLTASGLAVLGNISDNSGSNYAYGIEKVDDAIYISFGNATGDMFTIFKITANGIEAADGRRSYIGEDSTATVKISEEQKTALNEYLGEVYNTTDYLIKDTLASFFGRNENALYVIGTVQNTPFTITEMPYIPPTPIITLSGAVIGASSHAKLTLYSESGTFVEEYTDVFDDNGNYTVDVEEGEYNIVVTENGKVAFIDIGNTDGTMSDVCGVAGMTYAQLKDSADGEWTYTSTAGGYLQQQLKNFAISGDYVIELKLSGSSARGATGNAGIELFNEGKGYIRLIFGTDCDNGGGMNLIVSDGTTETKSTLKLVDNSGNSFRVGRFSSSSMSVNVKLIRVNNALTIAAQMDGNAYTEILTIDENGIFACNNGYAYKNHNNVAVDVATHFANKKEYIASYVAQANSFGFFHYSENAYTYACTARMLEIKKLSGNVTGAMDGEAMVEFFNEDGVMLATYETKLANGSYSIVVDDALYATAVKAIVLQNGKAAFLDTLNSVGEMADAMSMTGKTYAQKKDSGDGKWTFSAAAGQGVTQAFTNYAPTGDYAVEFKLSGSSARGGAGNAGIDILTSSSGYVRLIFGTDCNNGHGAYLLISDGRTETKTGIILQQSGADYSVGRFNSSSMSVNVKVVRVNEVITVSAAKDENVYTEILKIDENGVSSCDNGYTYLNHSKSSLDIATYFEEKASSLAGYTTGINTFRFFHYSTNAYEYSCQVTVLN